jgi:acetyl esterase
MLTGPYGIFDQTLSVETPGLGEGHVHISVCLPRAASVATELEREARPLILVIEGGGFVLGQPSDGGHIDRMLCDRVLYPLHSLTH